MLHALVSYPVSVSTTYIVLTCALRTRETVVSAFWLDSEHGEVLRIKYDGHAAVSRDSGLDGLGKQRPDSWKLLVVWAYKVDDRQQFNVWRRW